MSTGRVRLLRLVVMIPGGLALLTGLWAGLLRLGVDIPELRSNLSELHGPLLVSGFLGVVISIERAVALRRTWPYAAPIGAGAGTVLLLAGFSEWAGQALLVIASVTLVLVNLLLIHRQPVMHHVIMTMGAMSWAAGCILWLSGRTIWQTVPFLAGFLVMTIVGERLELSRITRPGPSVRAALLAATLLFSAGLVIGVFSSLWGFRIAGVGLLAQALWLARFDIARRTVRLAGLTRYMAVAFILGYVWLAVAGIAWTVSDRVVGPVATDVGLHAVFLGFVFSMIFAHAPVILPAVTGLRLPYRPALYIPLLLLHTALVVRFIGAAAENRTIWRIGGVGTESAIVLFILVAVASGLGGRRAHAGRTVDGVDADDAVVA